MDFLENSQENRLQEAERLEDYNPAPAAVWRVLSDEPRCELVADRKPPSESTATPGVSITQAAHDLNSLLAVIIGFSELIELDDDPNPEIAGKLSKIRQAGERAGALTRLILDLTRTTRGQESTLETAQPAASANGPRARAAASAMASPISPVRPSSTSSVRKLSIQRAVG